LLAGFLPWAVGWAIRNEVVAGNATNRTFVWHPITTASFETALYNISTFLMPVEAWRRELFKAPGIFLVLAIVILGAVLIWTAWKARRQLRVPDPVPSTHVMREGIGFTNGLFVFAYIASIFASMSLFDASTKFKVRILAPVYMSLLILLVLAGKWIWERRREAAIALAVVVFAVSAYGQASALSELKKGGQGYASFQWYDSKAMAFLKTLPTTVRVYTNEPGAVYLYTGRGSYVLPDHYDPVTGEARGGFERGVKVMQEEINAGRAVLALFGNANMAPGDAEAMSAGLKLAHKSAGDEVWTGP
jgi:hypothetical protein